eukprot:TRINITY_DN4672_c0_g1_i1.p2 TRINITY_DN4672_c0_g1~~TRINITY_DN4672_c0_g1_i1.p2  ORF type:complete len:225 (+),score=49.26 TRINITY_DN4672_c0_g1_i1:202-876(+)
MRQIWFMRHGEAAHNPLVVRGKQLGADTPDGAALLQQGRSILNPSLTTTGRDQATELHAILENQGFSCDTVVTTPLARAMETAQIALSGLADRFVVSPLGVETADPKLAGPQRGTDLRGLMEQHPFAAEWDLSELREGENWVRADPILVPSGRGGGVCQEGWINPVPAPERLGEYARWICGLEGRVVVVGHSGVFGRLLGEPLKNCELRPIQDFETAFQAHLEN